MDHVENKRVTVVILLQSVVEPKMEGGNPQYDLGLGMVFNKAKGSPSKRPGAGEPFALLKAMTSPRLYWGLPSSILGYTTL